MRWGVSGPEKAQHRAITGLFSADRVGIRPGSEFGVLGHAGGREVAAWPALSGAWRGPAG